MFSNLIFLILALLVVSFSSEIQPAAWMFSPLPSFALGMGLYLIFLGLIYLQNRLLPLAKNTLLFLVNLELLLFLSLYHFILGAQRIFQFVPFAGNLQTFQALYALFLYFAGLIFFYFTYSKQRGMSSAFTGAIQQIRFIIPFAIPFFLFTFLSDAFLMIPSDTLSNFLQKNENAALISILLFAISLAFMGLMLVILPPIVIKAWQCKPMKEGPLKDRLEALCKKAGFKHGGMLDWTLFNQSITAAIVGIIPQLRYVLFTKRLQEQLSPEAIEAILAHEIGHSYRKHLLLYPLILLGMVFCTGLFSLFFGEAITTWFTIQNEREPSEWWALLYPLAIFIPYVLIIVLYFRYVFGLFSRLFERQADLHGFVLGLPSENMINALDDVAIATGFTHLAPSWHHYSLQERIDFLRLAAKNPAVIKNHHRRVKIILTLYLVLAFFAFLTLTAPLFPSLPFFHSLNEGIQWTSKQMSALINS